MTEIDLLLRRWLPRPGPDPAFREEFEQLILSGALEKGGDVSAIGLGRKRRYYIGGAVVGAALAVGAAAVGWLKWGIRPRQAA